MGRDVVLDIVVDLPFLRPVPRVQRTSAKLLARERIILGEGINTPCHFHCMRAILDRDSSWRDAIDGCDGECF